MATITVLFFTLLISLPTYVAEAEVASSTSNAIAARESSEVDAASRNLATLKGRVSFKGKRPEAVRVSVTKDSEYCGKHVPDEQLQVEVSESGGLVGVVIEIRGVKEPKDGWKWLKPKQGYVIQQKGCAFSPSLLVMPNGEKVKVLNDDPVAHNINTGQWNYMQAGGAKPIEQTIKSRSPLRIGCNIHSWMEGWVYPAQSPYYAVSDKDGNYRIESVPPGKYRVTAWHPSLRSERERVQLDEKVEQDFVFKSPF